MPLVSVVIPTYNRALLIPETITSVLNQSFRDFEIIVVDDGSRDNTQDIVSAFPVTYIKQENQGLPNARNTGILASSGRYIAILDSDDCLLEQSLEKRVNVLEAHPQVGFAYTHLYTMDENSRITGLYRLPINSSGVRRGITELHDLLYANHIPASSVMIRRSCLDKVGLFNPAFIHGQEDLEMWVRLAAVFDSAYIPEPLLKLRIHTHRMTVQLDLNIIEKNHWNIINTVFQNPVLKPLFIAEKERIYANFYYFMADVANMRKDFPLVRKYTLKAIQTHPPGVLSKAGLTWTAASLISLMPRFISDFAHSITHRVRKLLNPPVEVP